MDPRESADGQQHLNTMRWIARRGPGMLGLTVEYRFHLGRLGAPIMPLDLALQLTWQPAGVAEEDPQFVHGFGAGQQLHQQLAVGAQVHAVTGLDRVLGRCGGVK